VTGSRTKKAETSKAKPGAPRAGDPRTKSRDNAPRGPRHGAGSASGAAKGKAHASAPKNKPPRTPAPEPEERTRKNPPDPPRPKRVEKDASGPSRAGRVAIVGRPNVGKSTFLNGALELPLAIVSPTPQTTRDAILGVVRRGSVEIGLLDTPGLHKPKTELGRKMNDAAREAARGADVVIFMTDIPKTLGDAPMTLPPGDLVLLKDLPENVPVVFVLNKVDVVKDKAKLFPLLAEIGALPMFQDPGPQGETPSAGPKHPLAAIIPISAKRPTGGVERVLDEVAKLCPEGPFRHGADDVTDKPLRFFAAEYVREQILLATSSEVPHAVAVVVDQFLEPADGGVAQVDATIHVERPGQKKILIGAGGSMLKRVGTYARKRFEALYGHQIHLKLWVRVTPDWRASTDMIDEIARTGESGETG
jgi:GTP-binding protein Era